ncbi:MAG: ABC transporter ATP-binding protein [bacterium]|nr:ABC transporter ATP-binding protein [bacterium]
MTKDNSAGDPEIPALAIAGLKKIYPAGRKGEGQAVEALKGVDLKVEQGDFFGLLGPNGAGKTTIIGIISSLVNKTAGRISVFEHDIDTHPYRARAQLGVVPQEINFNIFESVQQIVVNQAGFYGMPRKTALERSERVLRQLSLWEKRGDSAGRLSGGMKRRLMIARALMHGPRLLILDEPTAGVDIELRRSMWDFLRELNEEQGTTIILTTHYLEEAEALCRNIAIIDQGRIVQNTGTRELLAQLDTEVFVFDLSESRAEAPVLNGFSARLADAQSLEVEIKRGQDINSLFAEFNRAGVAVKSMRGKANRLEELFVRLVEPSAT